VSWAWWYWPLTWLTNHRPSVLWHCWLGHLTHKLVSEMTYSVSSGTLNTAIPFSAVTERLCNALCLSVVSFSSAVSRVHSSVISYIGFRLTTAYNLLMFCGLQRNIEASCHKHFVVRLPLSTNSTAYCYRRWVPRTRHGPAAACW